jgi:predicted DNA-binding protein with PD1-like motif
VEYVRVARERGARTFVLVFDRGDDLRPELARFSRDEEVRTGRLSGVGGFSKATLGYFNRELKAYEPIAVDEQVEVLSLLGTLAVMDGKLHAHIHAMVGFRDGSVKGGHVQAAAVWPTLEMFVSEYAGELHRAMVPDVGVALIDLS